MEERDTSLRKHRIPTEKRKECLKLFEEGYGYKKTAQLEAGTWFPSEYAGAGESQCPSFPDGNALRCIAMRIGSIPRFLD